MDRVKPGCYLKAKSNTHMLSKGSVYEVESVSEPTGYIKFKGINATYDKKHFTFWSQPDIAERIQMRAIATTPDSRGVTPETSEQGPENWRDYEFEIRHEEQIDDDLIRKDLSAQNPLMIAEVEGSTQVRVYIWQGLWTKVFNCKGTKRLRKELDMIIWANELWPSVIERSELPRLIQVLKRIKQAQWKKGTQAKVTVRKVKV